MRFHSVFSAYSLGIYNVHTGFLNGYYRDAYFCKESLRG